MRHSPTPSTAPRCTPKPTMRRVHWSMTTSTQWARRMADSHRNRSTLHKLSFACPRTVSQDGRRVRFRVVPNGENAPHHILVHGNAEGQGDLLREPPGRIPLFHVDDGGDNLPT